MIHWPIDLMSSEELSAAHTLRSSIGLDIASTYQFWEHMVARALAGRLTDHRCQWDVELEMPDGCLTTVEVKFATETSVLFRSGRRHVFKFAAPRGAHGKAKNADVYVLIGAGRADVWLWVVPAAYMRRAASITLTAPDQRNHTNARSYPMDRWQMPFDQLLPAVARASTCHLAYDTRLHRSNREASRRGDLIPLFAADETP